MLLCQSRKLIEAFRAIVVPESATKAVVAVEDGIYTGAAARAVGCACWVNFPDFDMLADRLGEALG